MSNASQVSQSPYEPLAYGRPAGTVANDAWRLLRLAVMLWASLVLIRHATYWGGVMTDRYATGATYRSSGQGFPFAEIEAAAEAVILFSMLVIAAGHRYARANAVLALRLLGAAFVLLVLTEIALNTDALMASSREATRARTVLKVVWQVVSKVQLLVVPALCAICLSRRLAAPGSSRDESSPEISEQLKRMVK